MLSIASDIVKYSESKHSSRKMGQRSLFDLVLEGGDFDAVPRDDFTDHDVSPQWLGKPGAKIPIPLAELEEERRLTGIYMSGHPMDFYAHDAQCFGKCSLAQAGTFAGKGNFTIVAILQGVSERLSKTGARLCYISLEDKTGRTEAIMGENDIPQAFPVPGTPVVVQAKISKLPDGTISSRIKVLKVLTLEEVRQQSIKKLTITLDTRQGAASAVTAEQSLRQLQQAIGSRKGPTQLNLEVIYPESTVRLKPTHGVELSDQLIRTIKDSSCLGRYG